MSYSSSASIHFICILFLLINVFITYLLYVYLLSKILTYWIIFIIKYPYTIRKLKRIVYTFLSGNICKLFIDNVYWYNNIDLDKKEVHAPKLVVINNIFFNIFTNLQVTSIIRHIYLIFYKYLTIIVQYYWFNH